MFEDFFSSTAGVNLPSFGGWFSFGVWLSENHIEDPLRHRIFRALSARLALRERCCMACPHGRWPFFVGDWTLGDRFLVMNPKNRFFP